ncbi:MAG: PAS domain S-box protein, partial [Deltaproteobacteria bacterium]|nr:PAS domain S-box protein [Deltaproteobacteria bacterium]
KQLLLSIVFDITDRKLVEKKLKESEQTARAILNASTESAFLIKKDGTFLDMNQITAERLGKDVEVLIGKNSFDMIPAKIAKSQRPILERIINEKQPILVRDERPGFILETNLNPVIDSNGNVSRIAIFAKDITQQEKIQKDLIASRKELLLRNQIADILLSYEGKEMYSKILSLILMEFESKYGLFGYIDENGDFISPSLTNDVWGKSAVKDKNFVFPRAHWGGLWGESLKSKKLLFSNQALNPPKGHVPLSRALACPIIYDSKLIGLLALANKNSDYTEEDLAKIEDIALYIAPIFHARLVKEKEAQKRQETEQLLRENEEKFIKAFHCNPTMAGLADLETGNYIEVNQTFYDKLGFTPDDVIGKRASEVVRMDIKFRDRVLADLKKNGQVNDEEALVFTKEGKPINIILYAQIIELQDKKYNFTSALDISELKQVENSLRIERDNLKNVYESLEDGIYIVDQHYNIEFMNQSLIKEFGPYREKKCHEYFYDRNDPCPDCIITDASKGETIRRELFHQKNQRYFDSIDTPLMNADGSISKLQMLRDITKRKRAEETIKASLKEKETLLQEIHHRVKNNLTIVASLLNLQANYLEDDQTKTALLDSKSRVQSMAAIHETLYQSENLASIDMKTYLSKLGIDVARNYATGTKAQLTVESENISIGAKQASPIGLIINELITNSLKYAFLNIEEGEINIKLKKTEDLIELEYADNGVGFPGEFDWKNSKTLGFKLVRNLVENQLDGSLDIKSENGTKFIIKFDLET